MEHKLSMDWFKIQQLPKLAKSRILSLLYRNCCGSDYNSPVQSETGARFEPM